MLLSFLLKILLKALSSGIKEEKAIENHPDWIKTVNPSLLTHEIVVIV